MKTYPCGISEGDVVVLDNGEEHIVQRFDGRYLYTTDGKSFKPNHPSIKGFNEVGIKEQEQPKKRTRKKKEVEQEETVQE